MKFKRLSALEDEAKTQWGQWAWEGDLQPHFSLKVLGYLLVAFVILIVLLAGSFRLLEMLIAWLSWLFWPVVILLGSSIFMIVWLVYLEIKIQLKRMDTATQSIRSASQGRIELVGRVQALDKPLVSPLFAIPCIEYRATLVTAPAANGQAEDKKLPTDETVKASNDAKESPFRWRDTKSQNAFLLCDEGHQVFVPLMHKDSGRYFDVDLQGKPPQEQFRDDVKKFLEQNKREVVYCRERLVPVGRLIQANAVFKTLNSNDDYVRQYQRQAKLSTSEHELESLKFITDVWRRHADSQESTAGGPTRLDVLLPLSAMKGIPLTARPYGLFQKVVDLLGAALLIVAVSVYFLMTWFGLAPSLPYFGLEL